jgi:hypothetical protein
VDAESETTFLNLQDSPHRLDIEGLPGEKPATRSAMKVKNAFQASGHQENNGMEKQEH